MNIDYYIPDTDNVTKGFSDDALSRLHMGRSVIVIFIVAFFVIFIAFWTGVLKQESRISYDWSFFMAWISVAMSLTSAILFSGAAICLRGEREREEALNMQYLMPGM
ncbi:hypothetical protein WDU94_007266 [Cyamophila willieti]